MRFTMTARTLLKMQEDGKAMNEITSFNVHKVTRFRKDGEGALEEEVNRLKKLRLTEKPERDEDMDEDEFEEVPDEALVKKMEVPRSFLHTRKKSHPIAEPGVIDNWTFGDKARSRRAEAMKQKDGTRKGSALGKGAK